MKKYGIFGLVSVTLLLGVWFVSMKMGEGKGGTLGAPMERFGERPKLLRFGMYVTPDPAQNPISPPERFIGYHTALDVEVFSDESEKDVPVFAVCSGNLVYKDSANGYGGVLIQSCTVDGATATVLYGHVDSSSVSKTAGDMVRKGEQIAILGDANSEETGDTRKHLHLGVHKGQEIELRGYVQEQGELEGYLDPERYIK